MYRDLREFIAEVEKLGALRRVMDADPHIELGGITIQRIVEQEGPFFDALQFFPKLEELHARTAGLLSGGERQMLAIAAALVSKPELLLVDELSLGLAPVVVEDLAARLIQVRRELGITILLVEQSAAVALEVADYSYVLENGRIVLDGDKGRLINHPNFQEFYLGQSKGKRRSYRDVKQYRRSRRWYG